MRWICTIVGGVAEKEKGGMKYGRRRIKYLH